MFTCGGGGHRMDTSQKTGKSLPKSTATNGSGDGVKSLRDAAALGYRFTRSDSGLILIRVLIQGGQERPLVGGLNGRMAQEVALMAQPMDLEMNGSWGKDGVRPSLENWLRDCAWPWMVCRAPHWMVNPLG